MSFIYGNENAMPGGAVSSNAFASGSDQNCGNVITDRPTTRLHAPPGGATTFSFGEASPARPAPVSRASQQAAASDARSNVNSQVFGAPSGGVHASSANAFANGADQNCGNVITDRPTTRLHAPPGGRSQISFGGDDAFVAPAPHRPDTAAFAAKEREQAGNDIFGAEPAPRLAVAESAAAAFVAPEAPPPAEIAATEVEIRAMMIAELRELCRAHGLSPAGAKGTLVDRLVDAIASGSIRVMVANRGASGVVADVNNYGRAEGQNVGNFMTGRNSSRVLAPPGGGSSFSLGGYGSEQHNTDHLPEKDAPSSRAISDAKALEISGHDVFDDGPAREAPRRCARKAELLQGHDIFDDSPDRPFVPGVKHSEAKLERDFRGHGVFRETASPRRPATALSGAKAAEIKGQNIFADGAYEGYARNAGGEMSEARAAAVAAMGGQNIFADGEVNRRTAVAVVKADPFASQVRF